MLAWFAETTLVALALAATAAWLGRWTRLGPSARHALWFLVLLKMVAPPIVNWPLPPLPSPAIVAVPERQDIEEVGDDSDPQPSEAGPTAGDSRIMSSIPVASPRFRLPDWEAMGRGAMVLWAVLSALIGTWQIGRVHQFRRRLRWAMPAPGWLVEEAEALGATMGVRVPEILVLPEAISPMLWCLGRPKLLLPAAMVKTLSVVGWRGILSHELAHLRRGDPWVRRLELAAGLLWWWNPLYWIACRRIEAEAELACDEMAVSAFPEGRLAFAEALLHVCRILSPPKPPAPALGVAGAGRFLERRVTMILREQAPSRLTLRAFLGVFLLALLALPGWKTTSAAGPIKIEEPKQSAPSDSDDPKADADEDDDDDEAEMRKAAEKKKKAELKIRMKKDAKAKQEKGDKEKGDKEAGKGEKESDLADHMAKMGEALGRDLEKQLGPGSDFQKEMEALGPKIEKAMKALEVEMEAKFGPGSDFEKEITKKFGPGSDFEKKIAKKFGPGSDFEKKMSKLGSEMEAKGEGDDEPSDADAKARAEASKQRADAAKERAKLAKQRAADARQRAADARQRAADAKQQFKNKGQQSKDKAQQIKELRTQIEKLSRQLEKLQDEDGDDEEDSDDEA